MVTIKYTPDGTEEWVAFHTDYASVGEAICLASDNSIYAAGQGNAVTIHYTQPTPITCEAPTGLFTNPITTIKARFNWTLEPDALQYEIWYKKVSAINWKKKFVPGINNKLNLKNLICNTNYVWKIRTVCDTAGVDLVSDFSPDQFFTTAMCREDEGVMEDNISIYPNPASNLMYINMGELTITDVKIIDITGKVVFSTLNAIHGIITIDVGNIPSGTYLIILQTPDEVINRQIIITK